MNKKLLVIGVCTTFVLSTSAYMQYTHKQYLITPEGKQESINREKKIMAIVDLLEGNEPLNKTDNIKTQTNNITNTDIQQQIVKPTSTPIPPISRGNIERSTVDKINAVLGGKLKNKGHLFVKYGEKYNVNSKMVAAIAIHESGNGTSNAIKTKNNVGGLMKNSGGLMQFATIEESIEFLTRCLRENYIEQGLNSIDKIQPKYCPVGALNDKEYNLNQYWLPNVTKYYNQISNQ